MLRDSNGRSWLLVVVFGTLAGMIVAELFTNFAGSNGVKDQWPWWQLNMLQFPLIVLSVGIGMGIYLKFSGLANLTKERVLKLLTPGARLEIVLRQDGWGILLAKYLISLDGVAIELPDFHRQTLQVAIESWSWSHSDNRVRLRIRDHLIQSVYPDLFLELTEKIVKGATAINPQVVVSQAGQTYPIQT